MFVVRCLLFVVRCALFVVCVFAFVFGVCRNVSLTDWYLVFDVCRLLCVARCSLFVVRCSLVVVCCLAFAGCCLLFGVFVIAVCCLLC